MFDNKTNASFAISPSEDNDKLVSLQSRMQFNSLFSPMDQVVKEVGGPRNSQLLHGEVGFRQYVVAAFQIQASKLILRIL